MNTRPHHTRKQLILISTAVIAAWVGSLPVQASTVAWWRFEEGPADANVARGGEADGVFYPGVADSSGNGNTLSAWSDGGFAGYAYRTDVAVATIPLTGDPNNFSVQNTGGYPALFTETGGALQTWTPSAWTIEVTFQPENGGYRTLVGRDSQGANTQGASPNADLSALYLQMIPGDALAIKYCDADGYWHEAISADGLVQGFDFPDTAAGLWQSAAAVSDGSTLSLFYRNVELGGPWQLVAQTDLTASGSTDTALTAGMGSGGDWAAGNFSVGRGLYAGGHSDRAWGFIDEVRLSDTALTPDQFLLVPEPTTLAFAGLGIAAMLIFRRR